MPPRVVAAARRSLGVAALLALAACQHATPPYHPRDALLRRAPVFLYPARDTTRAPRALVVFFGNDVGFWEPHQALATRLAAHGYTVVGVDVKQLLGRFPDTPARDTAFPNAVDSIVQHSRRELRADSVPLVLGGHSVGANLALWMAAHAPPPGLVGVLAMGPGERGHLRVTLEDLGEIEPREGDSWAVADEVRALPQGVPVALVRGAKDKYRYADPGILAAGGARLYHYVVPLAAHSLKRLVLAGPIIEHAVDSLVDTGRPAR